MSVHWRGTSGGKWRKSLLPKLGELRSVWEERYRTEVLMKEREDYPIRFETQRQNNPIIQTDSPVILSDIRYYDRDKKPHKFWQKFDIVSMTDPAARHKARNCETAIVVVGGNQSSVRDDIFVLEARMGHFIEDDVINHNFAVHKKYQPNHQGMESEGFQSLYGRVMELTQNRPQSFRLEPHPAQRHGRQKVNRLLKAAPLFRHNRIWFDRKCPTQRRIIDQLVSYQHGDKFDGGDAFCMAVNDLMLFFPPENKSRGSDDGSIERYISSTGRFIGYK